MNQRLYMLVTSRHLQFLLLFWPIRVSSYRVTLPARLCASAHAPLKRKCKKMFSDIVYKGSLFLRYEFSYDCATWQLAWIACCNVCSGKVSPPYGFSCESASLNTAWKPCHSADICKADLPCAFESGHEGVTTCRMIFHIGSIETVLVLVSFPFL